MMRDLPNVCSDSMRVGIPFIDADHERIGLLLTRLIEAARSRQRHLAAALATELIGDVQNHWARETPYLEALGYRIPDDDAARKEGALERLSHARAALLSPEDYDASMFDELAADFVASMVHDAARYKWFLVDRGLAKLPEA
jgi:hemerythrin